MARKEWGAHNGQGARIAHNGLVVPRIRHDEMAAHIPHVVLGARNAHM